MNKIHRLVLEEKEEEQIKNMEEGEQRELDQIMELLNDEEQSWGAAKEIKRNSIARAESRRIGKVVKSNATKREQKLEKLGARSKKFKHEVLGEDWGLEKPEPAKETHGTFEPPPTVPQPMTALEQGAEMEIEGATASSTGTCSLLATPKEQLIRKRSRDKILKASEKPTQ